MSRYAEDVAEWQRTNHGHLSPPTVAQFYEMHEDAKARSVYEAQQRTFFGFLRTPADIRRDFEDTTEINKYVLAVQQSEFARKIWPKFAAGKPVLFYEGIDAGPFDFMQPMGPRYLAHGASATTDTVGLTVAVSPENDGHNKPTVLHELAHVINAYEGIMRDHGPDFLSIFMKLVREYLPEKYERASMEFRRQGLTWTA